MASWWEDDADSGRSSGHSGATYNKKASTSLVSDASKLSSTFGASVTSVLAGFGSRGSAAPSFGLAAVGAPSTAVIKSALGRSRDNAADISIDEPSAASASAAGGGSRGKKPAAASKSKRGRPAAASLDDSDDENNTEPLTADAAPATPTSERTVTRSEISAGSWRPHVASDRSAGTGTASTARNASSRRRPMLKARIAASVACQRDGRATAAPATAAIDLKSLPVPAEAAVDAPLLMLDACAADGQSSMQARFRRVSRAVSVHNRSSLSLLMRSGHVSTRAHARKRVSDAFLPPLEEDEEAEDDPGVEVVMPMAVVDAAPVAAPVRVDRVLALVCEFVDTATLTRVAVTSRAFRDACVTARCFRVAHTLKAGREDACSTVGRSQLAPFLSTFPWGRFIAQGGYKTVYEVWNDARRAMEAVSIMNLGQLRGSGAFHLVCAEIAQSCMASTLAHTRVCPHFVLIHDVLVLEYDPAVAWPFLWMSQPPCPFAHPVDPALRVRSILDAPPARRAAAARAQPQPAWAASVRTSFQKLKKAVATPDEPFLLMRMDMCEDGDLEAYLRTIEPQVAALEAEVIAAEGAAAAGAVSSSSALLTLRTGRARNAVTPAQRLATTTQALRACDEACVRFASVCALQLCLALFTVRSHMWALHRDVKALNALCRRATGCVSVAFGTARFRYSLGDDSQPFQPRHMLKLTDFGTCVTGVDRSLSVALDEWCFTTIENVPPEYFLRGDQALCSTAVDTWALGLTLLHTLTGDAPYEEWMAACVPPAAFIAAMTRAWSSPSGGKKGRVSYDILVGVARECGWDVLTHTLYRQLVLLGDDAAALQWARYADTPVMQALKLLLAAGDSATSRGGGESEADIARRVYREHVAVYGLLHGTHGCVKRAQRRLKSWSGGWELLEGTLHPDPDMRPTMRSCILSPAFNHLRVSVGVAAAGDDVYDAHARDSDAALPCV